MWSMWPSCACTLTLQLLAPPLLPPRAPPPPTQGSIPLHWPLVNRPGLMLERLGRKELEAKRLEDDQRCVRGPWWGLPACLV